MGCERPGSFHQRAMERVAATGVTGKARWGGTASEDLKDKGELAGYGAGARTTQGSTREKKGWDVGSGKKILSSRIQVQKWLSHLQAF